ncbi:type II toxin-antitoxin system RelE/ParE family toxin [Candidatus Gracilibacteria bacterium]|nr:type II toxin-antitoxin system RelE/ParE family toxin [Candidatus Gracilibacteria bacterium]
MPRVIFTDQFRKDLQRFRHLSVQIEKQLDLFLQDHKHPSLHTKKLKPAHYAKYSFRVNKQFRIIFTFQEETPVLLYISKHYE